MSRHIATLLALGVLLGGCASVREVAARHPIVTGFVACSLVLSAGGALRHHDEAPDPQHIPTPNVNCANGSCQ